jgi:hypothetical protein
MSSAPPATGASGKPRAAKDFARPVAWLFGREFIASLQWMALHAAYKGKLDPRDWMHAEIFSLAEQVPAPGPTATEEFWLDYIADTGDGQLATYSVAYLCLSELWTAPGPDGGLPQAGSAVTFDQGPGNELRLPRGAFLFVGGDTGYHVADYATLANQFQAPFSWAFADLKKLGKVTDDRRPLFGIPGNHDYYDQLDGFHRQFRRPVTKEGEALDAAGQLKPQLSIPGFQRYQEASYVALRLPFDWWLWGVDTENDKIDLRQQAFFRQCCNERPPARLIVATPVPTTVHGCYRAEDSPLAQAFAQLGLERPFLRDGTPLPQDRCRLDLSGDTHHYARYWGTRSATAPQAPSAGNYASVVAGIGGAFLHPSQTDLEEIEEQALYPHAEESRREVASRLFNPLTVLQGGYIWLFGAVVAVILFLNAVLLHSNRSFVDRHLLARVGIDDPGPRPPGLFPPATDHPFHWGSYWLWGALLGGGLLVGVVNAAAARPLFGGSRPPAWALGEYFPLPAVLSALLVAGSLVLLLTGMGLAYQANLPPFGCSVVLLVTLAWSVAVAVNHVQYTAWLTRQVRHRTVSKWHYWPGWVMLPASVLALVSWFVLFGRHPAAQLLLDFLLVLAVAAVVVKLVILAALVGGELRGPIGKAGFALLGLSHALLQLAVPFLLVNVAGLLGLIVAAAGVVLFSVLGIRLARATAGRPGVFAAAHLALWLVYGGTMLVLPFLLHGRSYGDAAAWWRGSLLDLVPVEWAWGRVLLQAVLAAVLGAVLSCAWFGCYLAVALAFHGHNNECGGAARIEKFKGLVRIRLTPNDLTAFVIAVDEPGPDGARLRPRIIDSFRLVQQGSSQRGAPA